MPALTPRERRAVLLAAVVVVLAVVVGLGVLPAWRSLQSAQAQQLEIDRTLARVESLQAQARGLQNQARPSLAEALRLIEQSAKERLGAGTVVQGGSDRINVVFKGASAEAIAAWLAQVRGTARVWPLEARLTRSAAPAAPAASAGAVSAQWDGAVLLQLPTDADR